MNKSKTTYIIAEAGVNHNGSVETAKKMVEAAAQAGADAVKFQSFVPELLVTHSTPQALYQQRNTGEQSSQLEMLRQLALSNAKHHELMLYCHDIGIDYLSSPFDLVSLRYLCNEINLPQIKFGSGEITNAPLLLEAAEHDKKIILSTGMSTIDEIRTALGVIAFGYTHERCDRPSIEAFTTAYDSGQGQQALRNKVILLHCTSAYPCPYEEVNLLAMDTLANTFTLPVGYSDHTQGIEVAIAAAARGACIIEKHFTLDRNLPGPDHKASIEPQELSELVSSIRHVDKALGSAEKGTTESEQNTKSVARKHLVAAKAIQSGEVFSEENLTAKRSASGMSPLRYWELINSPAKKDYQPDEVIDQ